MTRTYKTTPKDKIKIARFIVDTLFDKSVHNAEIMLKRDKSISLVDKAGILRSVKRILIDKFNR